MKKNKLLKKVLAVSLAAAMMAGTGFTTVGQFVGTSVSVSAAENFIDDDFEYTVNYDNTVTITKYIGYKEEVVIPSKIDGKSVTVIGDEAFQYCVELTSVVIPNGVTLIGDHAFYDCVALENINISNSVTTISDYAFCHCASLTTISIPDSVTVIGDSAFGGCKSLTTISIPDSVTAIGVSAFSWCEKLISINVGKNNSQYSSQDGVLFNKDKTTLLQYPQNKGNSYAIPNGVIFIGDFSFEFCTTLTNITIPNSVKKIGAYAFIRCEGLTNIEIPNSVTSIDWHAFYCCTGLTSITIPSSVTDIGGGAFESCTSLTSFVVDKNNRYYLSQDGVLFDKAKTGLIQYPSKKEGTDYVVPNGVRTILNYAFESCSFLKSVTIPSSVENIDSLALRDTKFTDIIVDKNNAVYSSQDGVLFNKEKTELIKCPEGKKGQYTIPNGVIFIKEDAFEYCDDLTEVVISDTVTAIEDYAFTDCDKLISITIPKSVTEIGSDVFWGSWNATICGEKDSYAETYANENNMPFVELKALENNAVLSAERITLGDTVTVSAGASGGKGNYTYAVLYKKKTDTKWTVKQNYSTNDNITVKPAKVADYDICVKVKDCAGNIVKKFFTVMVSNLELTNTSTISATTIKKGNTVTVNGSAIGGNGNYTYAVLYKKKLESKWTVRQGYKDNAEILVRPYTNTDYDICIKVKDENGTIAKKYFTVTVQ